MGLPRTVSIEVCMNLSFEHVTRMTDDLAALAAA